MKEWFELSWEAVAAVFITGTGVYVAVILLTRLSGKRSFSKMSSFDFAMTVAVGSIVASTLFSKSVSLWQGIAGLVIVYFLQLTTAYARRNDFIRKITDNEPMLLMDGGKILHDNLKKGRVTESDLRGKLREANVTQLSQVKAVVFETTGDISVLHNSDNEDIDEYIMQDVIES